MRLPRPNAFRQALQAEFQQVRQRNGEGFRLLTGRVTSPTLLRQIDDLLQTFPKAAWHAYEPIDDDNAEAGAALAFGRPLRSVPHLDEARVLVALDADPLGHGPDQLGQRPWLRGAPPSAAMAVFAHLQHRGGTDADRRQSRPSDRASTASSIGEVAIAIAGSMGAAIREASLPDRAMRLAKHAAADLSANPGGAVVLAGRALPPEIHALAHWINAQLQAPIDQIEIDKTPGGRQPGTLSDLVRDLEAGEVEPARDGRRQSGL